jgi:hypothetical protein
VAGWRTCEGNENSILDCAPQGNPTGTESITTIFYEMMLIPLRRSNTISVVADPECRYGCDSSCTHSLDQGATCFNSETHFGSIKDNIPQCSGVDRYATLGPKSQDESQTIRFGCIEYQTANCEFSTLTTDTAPAATLVQATRAFAMCAEQGEQPGYCHGLLQSANKLSNQDVCTPPPGCNGRVTSWLQEDKCFTSTAVGQDTYCNHDGDGSCDGLSSADCVCAVHNIGAQSKIELSLPSRVGQPATIALSEIVSCAGFHIRVPFVVNTAGEFSFRLCDTPTRPQAANQLSIAARARAATS